MTAQTEAERLIKDAFYDARNAGSTMDTAAANAAQKLVDANLLLIEDHAGHVDDSHAECTWVCGRCGLAPESHSNANSMAAECVYEPTLRHNHTSAEVKS